MNLGILGSKNFNNYKILHSVIQRHFVTWEIDNIISHNTLAEKYANEFNINIIATDDDLIWSKAHTVIAFWDGVSKEIKMSFKLSQKHNKDLLIIEYLRKDIYWHRRKVDTYLHQDESISIDFF